MSLQIDVDSVTAVLLADGWHTIKYASFDIDAYEFHEDDELVLGGGQCSHVPSTGFRFTEDQGDGELVDVFGPLTSILAIRTATTLAH